jgi:hypothetical protein
MQIETPLFPNRAFDTRKVLAARRAALPKNTPGESPAACPMLIRLSDELATDPVNLSRLPEEPKRGKAQ